MTTVAGSTPGYQDDEGTQSQFNYPRGICYNPNEDFFLVCDRNNHKIRKLFFDREITVNEEKIGLVRFLIICNMRLTFQILFPR